MQKRIRPFLLLPVIAISIALVSGCGHRTRSEQTGTYTRAEKRCVDDGWEKVSLNAANIRRDALWKGPDKAWRNGAIIVMHGGGGTASNFCAGGWLVRPQIHFTQMAIDRGVAVFALDSTNDRVTDANGRVCGKRFDFMVLDRPNLDLPYIGELIDRIIPARRPTNSSKAIFLTGLSTGGYMTIRAASYFDNKITAFAPISAGDPYGTDSNCDASLSRRKSAKGVLLDKETGREITRNDACRASSYANEKRWLSANPKQKPAFRQFHHQADGIVDISCMEKAGLMLRKNGYSDRGVYLINATGKKSVFKHLWLDDYNEGLLDFFASEASRAR